MVNAGQQQMANPMQVQAAQGVGGGIANHHISKQCLQTVYRELGSSKGCRTPRDTQGSPKLQAYTSSPSKKSGSPPQSSPGLRQTSGRKAQYNWLCTASKSG